MEWIIAVWPVVAALKQEAQFLKFYVFLPKPVICWRRGVRKELGKTSHTITPFGVKNVCLSISKWIIPADGLSRSCPFQEATRTLGSRKRALLVMACGARPIFATKARLISSEHIPTCREKRRRAHDVGGCRIARSQGRHISLFRVYKKTRDFFVSF